MDSKLINWILKKLSKNSGDIYSDEEFKTLEKPLLEIDPILQEFSRKYNLEVAKNIRGWPERSLMWRDDNGIERLIQIYMDDKTTRLFNLWISASKDKSNNRYWKNIFLKEKVPFNEISEKLNNLLEEAYKTTQSWKEEEFQWATKLDSST